MLLDIRLVEVISFSAEDAPRGDLREETGERGGHIGRDEYEENSDTTDVEEDLGDSVENDEENLLKLQQDAVKGSLHS